MGILDVFGNFFKGSSSYSGVFKECPNCKKKTDIGKERCSHCGTRISSMFRKKCPKCSTMNELDAAVCKKCNYSFAEEMARAKKKLYKCPLCGYEADYFMMKCPACGARFG